MGLLRQPGFFSKSCFQDARTNQPRGVKRIACVVMSHLAQFSSLSKQGELLCTQALTYLLEKPEARAAFAAYIAKRTGRTFGSDLTWRAEVRQQDGGRPDLEAAAEGKLVAKIEAKLGASFGEGQLSSFLADLQSRCGSGLLLVLVPLHRAAEMTTSVPSAFGNDPWRTGDTFDCSVAVIYWEEILEALGSVSSEPFRCDLAQFCAMYRVLKGYDIEPLTSHSELLAWREKEGIFVTLVDRVTRRLTQQGQVLPMG